MSRLKKRLGIQSESPNYYQPNQEEDYEYESSQNYNQQSPLIQEYERLQKEAVEYDKELQTMEAMNPHTIYKDVITNPIPKGVYKLRLFGRPVDLAKLEHYLIHKVSPKTVTTLMRYNDSRTIEEVKGYSKRPNLKIKGGIIWIILGAAALLIIGVVFMSTGGNMTEIMQGMFGT